MRSVPDWSGRWPRLGLNQDFATWSRGRLILGVQVAAIVGALFVAAAAEIGGYKVVALVQLGMIFAAVLTRVEWLNSARNLGQERHN